MDMSVLQLWHIKCQIPTTRSTQGQVQIVVHECPCLNHYCIGWLYSTIGWLYVMKLLYNHVVLMGNI